MAWTGNLFGFSFSVKGSGNSKAFIRNAGGSDKQSRNLSNAIFPTSFEQAKIDLASVANALAEAQKAGWPFRVDLQKIYEKTILNDAVISAIQRRKELTLLRDFEITDSAGAKDQTWTDYFKKSWFTQHTLHHILNAEYHGFSLISIGEIKAGVPGLITSVKRWNISPDRKHVSIFEKSPAGYSWEDAPYDKWHIWVPTLQENGINGCGYGLLLVTAILEILQRNNVQYNADYNEIFANPFRWLKTNDLDGEEFERKKKDMQEMGHNAYLITGLSDELEFLTDASRGQGFKTYSDFDGRQRKFIAQWIGGHPNFLDDVSNDSSKGGISDDATGNTPLQRAVAAKRTIDGDFVTTVVNETLIPKLQDLGVMIPAGHKIKFLNDSEERSVAAQEADKNQKIGTLALTFAQAGLKMSKEYAEKATGITFTEIDIEPDKNVLTKEKEQAAGAGPLKDASKKREDKPKHT